MRDFYAVTKVRSSIYDGNYQKILSYPDEHTPICSIMHGRADTLAHCKYSNLIYVHSNNVKKKKAPLYIPVISVSPKSLLLYGITT